MSAPISNEEIAKLIDELLIAHKQYGFGLTIPSTFSRAADALEVLKTEREWKPIETAPTNGRFLAINADIPNHRMVIAMRDMGGHLILDEKFQPVLLTHWRHVPRDLPPPPAPKEKA